MHSKNRWDALSPRTRKLILVGATVDGALKVVAVFDLLRRPADEIRGSKTRWAVALIVVNSAGALPIYYLAYGRRPRSNPGRGSQRG